MIGHLLEAEKVGYVDWLGEKVKEEADWVEGPLSPFSIEIGSDIRPFAASHSVEEARTLLSLRRH